MKPKRKARARPVSAQVISLAAYRESHRSPVPGPAQVPVAGGGVSVMEAYCRWIALAGAVWTFWW